MTSDKIYLFWDFKIEFWDVKIKFRASSFLMKWNSSMFYTPRRLGLGVAVQVSINERWMLQCHEQSIFNLKMFPGGILKK